MPLSYNQHGPTHDHSLTTMLPLQIMCRCNTFKIASYTTTLDFNVIDKEMNKQIGAQLCIKVTVLMIRSITKNIDLYDHCIINCTQLIIPLNGTLSSHKSTGTARLSSEQQKAKAIRTYVSCG